MSELHLEALRPTSALGFLAAVGVLRLVTEELALASPRLGWPDGLGGGAVLAVDDRTTINDVAQRLYSLVDECKSLDRLVPGLDGFPLNVGASSGSDPMRGLTFTRGRDLSAQAQSDVLLDRWLSAFVAPAAPNEGTLELTQLLTAGPGTVWVERTIRGLLNEIAEPESMVAALVSWRRTDSIGAYLDARADVDAARASRSTGAASKYGEPTASWLAIMSLPCFPSRATGDGRGTVGWRRTRGKTYFRYPVWLKCLPLRAVVPLLDHPVVMSPRARDVESLGVAAVMESERLMAGNYNGPLAEPRDVLVGT